MGDSFQDSDDEDGPSIRPSPVGLINFLADLFECNVRILNEVQVFQEIGKGAFSSVWCGKSEGNMVAVKFISLRAPVRESGDTAEIAARRLSKRMEDISHEVRIMSNGILRRCPNILRLCGISFDLQQLRFLRPSIILNLACSDHPTLSHLMQSGSSHTDKLLLVRDILNGLSALNYCRIVHGDLRPDTILLFHCQHDEPLDTRDFRAVISDFGSAFLYGHEPRSTGTEGWSAPECSRVSTESSKSSTVTRDIYSFGAILWALFQCPIAQGSENACDVKSSQIMEYLVNVVVPAMKSESPVDRPDILKLRNEFEAACNKFELMVHLWGLDMSCAAITLTEIQPSDLHTQKRDEIATWLIQRTDLLRLPQPVQHLIFELMLSIVDNGQEEKRIVADYSHAVSLCYKLGLLTSVHDSFSLQYLAKAARLGHPVARMNALWQTRYMNDKLEASVPERYQWSLDCLSASDSSAAELMRDIPLEVCERGLAPEVATTLRFSILRNERRYHYPPLSELFDPPLDGQDLQKADSVLTRATESIVRMRASELGICIEELLSLSLDPAQVLAAILRLAIAYDGRSIIFFLIEQYGVDPSRIPPGGGPSPLQSVILSNKTSVLASLLEAGIDRQQFLSRPLLALLATYANFAMSIAFIRVCTSFVSDMEDLSPLLDEGARASYESEEFFPPPIIISLISRNSAALRALVEHGANVNLRYKSRTPLLIAVETGQPYATAILLSYGANPHALTDDTNKWNAFHLLASGNGGGDAEQLGREWEERTAAFNPDRMHQASRNLRLTDSQQQRFPRDLLFHILLRHDVALDRLDALGRSPMDIALTYGNIAVALRIQEKHAELHPDDMDSAQIGKYKKDARDGQGMSFADYALEDN